MRFKKEFYGICRKCQKHVKLYSSFTCASCHKKEIQLLEGQVTHGKGCCIHTLLKEFEHVNCDCEQKRRFTKPSSGVHSFVQVGNKNSKENIHANHFVIPSSLFSNTENNENIFEMKESLFGYKKAMSLCENATGLSNNEQKKRFDPILASGIVQKADQMFSSIKVELEKLKPTLEVYDAVNNDRLEQLLMITFFVQKILGDLLTAAQNDSTLTNTGNDMETMEVVVKLTGLVATSTDLVKSFGIVVSNHVNSFQIANENACNAIFNNVCDFLITEEALFDSGDFITNILTNGAECQELSSTETSSTSSITTLYKNLMRDEGDENESLFSGESTSDDDFDENIYGYEDQPFEADEHTCVHAESKMVVIPIVVQLINSVCLE